MSEEYDSIAARYASSGTGDNPRTLAHLDARDRVQAEAEERRRRAAVQAREQKPVAAPTPAPAPAPAPSPARTNDATNAEVALGIIVIVSATLAGVWLFRLFTSKPTPPPAAPPSPPAGAWFVNPFGSGKPASNR